METQSGKETLKTIKKLFLLGFNETKPLKLMAFFLKTFFLMAHPHFRCFNERKLQCLIDQMDLHGTINHRRLSQTRTREHINIAFII